jgi:hypothetical protein
VKQKTSSDSTNMLDGLEEIYLKRISNVDLLDDGCALTFFSHNDLPAVATLIRVLMENDQVSSGGDVANDLNELCISLRG